MAENERIPAPTRAQAGSVDRVPYEQPSFRKIGSVRELTLSGSPQISDGAITSGPNVLGGH